MIQWCQRCETEPVPYSMFTLPLCGPCSYVDRVAYSLPGNPWVIYAEELDRMTNVYTLASIGTEINQRWLERENRAFWRTVLYGPDGVEPHIIRSEN